MTATVLSDAKILAALKATFGYSSFRPLQREIVDSILAGRDVFVLMPTGGGKSLCYQLPALLRDGMTVVVSPLIALMKDQVDALCQLGVAATFVNSSLDANEIGRRQGAIARGEVKLLYVAPERLMMPAFLHLLSAVRPAYFAIDEAHCISEWGHDFRPEYRALSQLRDLFPGTNMGAFTATATARVQTDIKAQLRLQRADGYRGSFNRSNLYYDVRPKDAPDAQLLGYLRRRERASGIIYCATRAGTEQLAERLRRAGFSAAAYHAGLEAGERRKRQEDFIKDNIPIIVATIAFGMGIDKPDVRFVVHYDLPKSLEGYYQESGRAGRDGESSDCILFFGYGDAAKQRYFIDQKSSPEERQVALYQLKQMVDWAASSVCRRRGLLSYFDELLDHQVDPCCDICRLPRKDVDYTIAAQMFLSCAKRTGERFGAGHLIEVLRGSHADRVLTRGHDKLSVYGIGRDRSKEDWEFLARELLCGGYVRQAGDRFPTLAVTPLGNSVLLKREQVILSVPVQSDLGRAQPDLRDEELFERLRALRKRLADERGVAPYVIFHDSSLRQMAEELPTTPRLLRLIQGVGQRKVEDYGDQFLACIANYVRSVPAGTLRRAGSAGLNSKQPRPKQHQPKQQLGPTAEKTLELFRSGKSLPAIAQARGLKVPTIEGHLCEAIEHGEIDDLSRLVSLAKRPAIEAALDELGQGGLSVVLERLGNGYSYAELKFVRSAMRRNKMSDD